MTFKIILSKGSIVSVSHCSHITNRGPRHFILPLNSHPPISLANTQFSTLSLLTQVQTSIQMVQELFPVTGRNRHKENAYTNPAAHHLTEGEEKQENISCHLQTPHNFCFP